MLGVSGTMAMIAGLLTLPRDVKSGLLLGIALAAMNGIASFLSLHWSFRKSNKIFFTIWSAGLFMRVMVLAAAAYAVYGNPAFDFLSTLLSLVFATFLFLLLELDFLPKRTA